MLPSLRRTPTTHPHHRWDRVQVEIRQGQGEELALTQTRPRRGQHQDPVARWHPGGDVHDPRWREEPLGQISALHTDVECQRRRFDKAVPR